MLKTNTKEASNPKEYIKFYDVSTWFFSSITVILKELAESIIEDVPEAQRFKSELIYYSDIAKQGIIDENDKEWTETSAIVAKKCREIFLDWFKNNIDDLWRN